MQDNQQKSDQTKGDRRAYPFELKARSRMRAQALQLLFQAEERALSPQTLVDLDEFILEDGPLEPEALQLAQDAWVSRQQEDQLVESLSHNWSLTRISKVDKSILRLGLAELQGSFGTDTGTIIDEAVELAKRYSSEQSYKFINGVLRESLQHIPKRRHDSAQFGSSLEDLLAAELAVEQEQEQTQEARQLSLEGMLDAQD